MRVQPADRMRRLFCEAVLLIVGFHSAGTAVWAGPEGATVVHGTATFQQSGSYTAIQASDKAIINYHSFDVARPETVQFIQPGAGATVLNRILSANPTTIDGTILANGRVFFVNPAGVIFGESAQVNVAQLVASALDISNTDFLNGRYDFKGGDGAVVNKGQISAERAYLIGKQVANLGKIDCPGGYVVMAAGDRVFLGEPGTDLLVEMDEPTPADPTASVDGAAVRNEGSVDAAGGSIVLAAAGDIYAHAISNVGRLSASASGSDAGTVKLAAPEGTVINTGTIEASSESGKGGQVQVLGERVGLFESGRIDASGATGGGTVLVGGDYQGQGEVPSACRTSVGANASIQADATRDGDGGEIIVWSEEMTRFDGHASARGAGSGQGGLIEVSGKQDLSFAGTVALDAPGGHGGTLLLDPDVITITDGGENLAPQDDLAFGDGPYPATISEVTLENTAAGSNAEIVLEATNDIVIDDLTDNALTLSPGVSLVLRTRNDPSFEDNYMGGITMSPGDSIIASGGGDLTLQAGHDGTGFVAGSAAHVSAGSLITDGGSVTVQATGDVSVESVTTAGAANAAGGGVVLEAGVGTASYYLDIWGTIDTSGGPDVDASGANPAGSVALSGGTVSVRDIIATGGNDNGGDAPGGTGGPVTIGAPLEIYLSDSNIRTSGGSGSLVGNGGNVTFDGPTSLGGDLTITAGSGDVTFLERVDGVYGDLGLLPANLVVNSAGTTRFELPAGEYYPITSVTTDAPGTTQINADITTGDETWVPLPATQIYNDPVLLTNDVTLTDYGTTGIFLNSTVDSAAGASYALTIITNAGETVFGGAVGSDALGAVSNDAGLGAITVSGAGSTRINGGLIRSAASQMYDTPVILNSPTVLTGNSLTFNSTIAAGTSDLTLTGDSIALGGAVSGTGALTLQPATPTRPIYVGMIGEVGLNLDDTELGYLQNGFNMINIGRMDGQHSLYIYQTTFQDPVTFRSPAGPAGGIYVMGKITGTDNASFTLMGAGATTVLYDGIETPGQDIVIQDSVQLGDNADITLSTGAGGGNISIAGPVNGTASVPDMGDESLTLAAGTGTITVGGIFGASGVAAPEGLTTIQVSTSGTATFGRIGITGALDATSGDMTFLDTVSIGSGTLSGTNVDFGDSLTTLGNVDVSASGAIVFGGALTLGGDLMTTAAGNVTFGATVDDDGDPQTSSNAAISSAGVTRFNGAVGDAHPIDSLSTDAAGTTEINANITTGEPLTVLEPGPATQTYNDPVILTSDVTLTDHGTTGIFFNNTVGGNGQDPWNLRVQTTDPTAQVQFNEAVTLYSGLWVQTAGGNVTFQGTIDAEAEGMDPDLTVYSAGTTRFNAAVGGLHPLGRLYTDAAGTTEINANITTGGTQWYLTQTYDDPVVLTNSVTLTDTGMDGITFNNTIHDNGAGPWDLTVVTTDAAARIQFNGEVSLDGGVAATAAGDIYANSLLSASHNISLRSTAGNLNLSGTVNADRDADGNGGGVSLTAEAGLIQTHDGILGVTIIGYSDGQRGADLPYATGGTGGKTAIRIDSGEPLHLASYNSLIARGRYEGSYQPLAPGADNPWWVRDLEGSTVYYGSGFTDDRAALGFSRELYDGGVPLDVAIYLRSRSGNVILDTPVITPDGATVVLDAFDTISFGTGFTTFSSFPDTSRLEVVSRATTSLATEADRSRFPYSISYSGGEVQENQSPAWFTGYASVLRGGVAASYLATTEYWRKSAPVPPPLPPIVVPDVVPPILTIVAKRLSWITQAEVIVGPIQPPHPECMDVKDQDIDILRRCQVACDLFSTDVALNVVAEDVVTLNQRLKMQVQQVLPRLDTLSQKWPRVRPGDMPAIEQALRQDQALNDWLQDGVEFVKLLRTKLGRTTNDSVERFLLEYLADTTDESVLDFVQIYLKSRLASMAEANEPVAWIGR